MKKDRTLEIKTLAQNLELTLQHENDKYIAFTSDEVKFDMMPLLNEVIENFSKDKKIAVLSYDKVNVSNNAKNIVIDALTTDVDSIKAQCEEYDIVVVICPNVLEKNNYLSMAKFVKLITIVAKKWKTKVANIQKIKFALENEKLNVLGIIYQN